MSSDDSGNEDEGVELCVSCKTELGYNDGFCESCYVVEMNSEDKDPYSYNICRNNENFTLFGYCFSNSSSDQILKIIDPDGIMSLTRTVDGFYDKEVLAPTLKNVVTENVVDLVRIYNTNVLLQSVVEYYNKKLLNIVRQYIIEQIFKEIYGNLDKSNIITSKQLTDIKPFIVQLFRN